MIKRRLFTPGPVEVPARLQLAMAQPLLHHRSAEFEALLHTTLERLRPVFGTRRPVLAFAASGTGALEAAVVNLVAAGETALAVRGGKFGERWGELLAAHGIPWLPLDLEWGAVPEPARLERALAAHPEVQVVFLTHSETSTGTLCDLQALAAVARGRGCRVVADCVTSACAHPIEMDGWGLDAVISGSQKGFMLPPGLAMIALSEEAAAGLERAAGRRYYFDLAAALAAAARSRTPFTPAVSLVVGLAAALSMLEEEGLEHVIARHARLGDAARAAMRALDLELLPEQPSNVVTVVRVPAALEAARVRDDLEQRFGVKIAGGQGRLKGKILRLGHLGHVDATDLFGALAAFERVLLDQGWPATPGAAVAAAESVFAARPGTASAGG